MELACRVSELHMLTGRAYEMQDMAQQTAFCRTQSGTYENCLNSAARRDTGKVFKLTVKHQCYTWSQPDPDTGVTRQAFPSGHGLDACSHPLPDTDVAAAPGTRVAAQGGGVAGGQKFPQVPRDGHQAFSET